jgi:hypothetical protein
MPRTETRGPEIRSTKRAVPPGRPIGGQVEPSAQLKAVPIGVQPAPGPEAGPTGR